MSHYFETPAGAGTTRRIAARIRGHDLAFDTARGVFSGDGLDHATSLLLRSAEPPAAGRVLDLGCGWGPIAVGLAVSVSALEVDAVDTNERAVELCRANAELNGVADRVRVSTPEAWTPARYTEIWTNPPIRIGKQALHALLLRWLPTLLPGGVARMVVGKNLGADSLQRWLTEQGWPTERTASAKGFRILRTGGPDAVRPPGP